MAGVSSAINVSARFGLVLAAVSFVLIDGSFWVLRISGGGFGLHRRWCLVDACCVRPLWFWCFAARLFLIVFSLRRRVLVDTCQALSVCVIKYPCLNSAPPNLSAQSGRPVGYSGDPSGRALFIRATPKLGPVESGFPGVFRLIFIFPDFTYAV